MVLISVERGNLSGLINIESKLNGLFSNFLLTKVLVKTYPIILSIESL